MFTWSSRDLPSRQGVLTGRNIMCEGTEVIQGAAFGFWTWDYAELPVLSRFPEDHVISIRWAGIREASWLI